MKLSIDLSINCTYFQPNFGIAQYVIQTKCTKFGKCLFLSSEVALGRSEAAVNTRYALHLAMSHIVVELLIRGAGGIVADAGKLADADVVVRLEVFVQRIGQFGGRQRLAHLALYLKLYIGQAVEQVLVGTEADSADLYVLARRRCRAGVAAQLHGERAKPIELYTVAVAQGIGDDSAQCIPHELYIGGRGGGGVADVVSHLLNVDLLRVGNGYGYTLYVGFCATNEAAASQFAVYHRGVAPVMMHMLRFLDFHRR